VAKRVALPKVGDRIVERSPHYLLGPRVVVVGKIVGLHENGVDAWVTGLRVPDQDPGESLDWDDPYLFGLDELRPYRPRYDKAYFLRRSDLRFLREIDAVQPRNAAAEANPPETPAEPLPEEVAS
jgi:hypothetical protein